MRPWVTRSHPFPLPWRSLVDSPRLAYTFVLLLGDLSQHGNLLEQIGGLRCHGEWVLAICSRMCATRFCRQGMRECIFGRIQDCSPHSTLQRVLALGTSYPRDVFKLHSPAAHLQCPLKMQSSLSWEKNITWWLFLACVTWDKIWKEITPRRHMKDKKEAVWLFSL